MTFDLPRPIRGFPELNWAGKHPFTSMHYFPAQLKESYGDSVDGWMNKLYWGDNLQVMGHLLREFRGKVDLVYIDPPFDSKADYKKAISLKNRACRADSSAFEEKQYSDIWTNDEYLQFMYERVIILRELLSSKGSLFLHCDPRKGHYLRCILDEVFGSANFRNEIVWHYTGGGRSESTFSRKHDLLLAYSKSGNYIFNGDAIRIPYKETSGYFKGGIVARSGKKYLPNPMGTLPDDVWDIPIINPLAHERLEYPTQKPEALLERIIKSSTNPGSLVLDCFMGSGTAMAVAMKLGRRFLGADINMGAMRTTAKRLLAIMNGKQKAQTPAARDHLFYYNFESYNVNNYDIFRNPAQARDLLIEALEIARLAGPDIFDGMKDGYKVKIMPVNRIATRKDLLPIVNAMDYRALDSKLEKTPNAVLDKIMLVCMGHEPDLAANLKMEIGKRYNIDVKVVDLLREKERGLVFKHDSEAEIAIEGDELVIRQFYPLNLLQKLSLPDENVDDWRQLAESVAIDWNYNGEVLRPAIFDCPPKEELVKGRYKLPAEYGPIRVKITDLLSESLEITIGPE